MKIVYIHGISRQLPQRALKYSWDVALLGSESKDTYMSYWSHILHGKSPGQSLVWEDVEKDLLKTYLNDVYRYLFEPKTRQEIEQTLISILDTMNEPFILVSHSLGSVIAWKVVCEYERRLEIPLFLLLGSPLGIDRLQVELKKIMGIDRMYKPPGVIRMTHFADPFDPVAADKTIADEFQGRLIKDRLIMNPDQLRTDILGPHSSTGYMRHEQVRGEVANAVLAYSNPVTRFLYKLGS